MSLTPKRDEHVGVDKNRAKCTQDEKQAVQERTFTEWINIHLKRCDPPLQITNLFTDIQDGKILMALIEELSGCSMLDRFRPFPHHIFRLNNISKVLNFLEDRNVSLINIDANDIADGSPSAVLRLIWNIIVYYQIKQVTGSLEKFPSTFSLLSLPCGIDPSGRSSPGSPGDDIFGSLPSKGKRSSRNLKYRSTALKSLFSWAQNCTAKYGVEIHDFGKSWRSGLAFVALVKVFCPEFVDMRKALSSEPRQNMETAFTAAHEWLGIPPLLDPDDVAVHSPDEQSIITYVSQFLECCPGHDEDCASTDSSRGTPNSTDRWDRTWTDSVNSMSPSISTEALKGLHNPSDTSQYHTGDQVLISESLPVGLSTVSESFFTMKSSSWSNGHFFSDSTGGQCCDSLSWANSFIASLEDDGKCSEVSKKAVCAMSVLDSDEEDAYSYILELDHKEAEPNLNIDSESNTIMDARLIEVDLNVANMLESQRSERTSHFCETLKHLSPKDGLIRSGDDNSTDENVLDQVLTSKDICVTQTNTVTSDFMYQTGIDDKEIIVSSSDEHHSSNCSFKMKESMSSDVFTLNHSIEEAFMEVENGLNEDKTREDLFLGAVKDSQLDNEQYEQNRVLDRSVLDRTEESAILHTQRKEFEELHVLLFLWMIAYFILMYPHLDFFSLLSPN